MGCTGGRIDDDEKFYDGLMREVKEETGLAVEVIEPVYIGEWWPVIREVPNHIVAMFVACRAVTENVVLSKEHDDYAWVDADSLPEYAVMSPDDEPIKRALGKV